MALRVAPLFSACSPVGPGNYLRHFIYKFHKINEKNLKGENMTLFYDKLVDEDTECQAPSKDNPFGNLLISDIQDNPKKKKACKITNPNVKEEIEEIFGHNLYRDVNDVYSKNNSQRQFYSNPSTNK